MLTCLCNGSGPYTFARHPVTDNSTSQPERTEGRRVVACSDLVLNRTAILEVPMSVDTVSLEFLQRFGDADWIR